MPKTVKEKNYDLYRTYKRLDLKQGNVRAELRCKDETIYLYIGLGDCCTVRTLIGDVFNNVYIRGRELRTGDIIRFGDSKVWVVKYYDMWFN